MSRRSSAVPGVGWVYHPGMSSGDVGSISAVETAPDVDMAITAVEDSQAAPSAAITSAARRVFGWRFATVCISHTAVDFLSAVVVPILSVLEGRVHLEMKQGALLLAIGSVCSGVVQPAIAWLSDRFNTRLFGPLGLILAGLCIGSIGWVTSFGQLVLVQVVLTAGIGAFHPVGASAIGQLSATRRSLGVAVFFTFGMVGSFSGSKLVPIINEAYGLRSFVWFLLPAAAVGLLLWIAIRSMSHRADNAQSRAAAFAPRDRGDRWGTIGILYCSNILRFTVNMALAMLFVRFAEEQTLWRTGATELTEQLRATSAIVNGNLQAAMTVGMAIGGLSAGATARSGHEKPILVGSALIGVPAVALAPFAPYPLAVVLASIAGIGFAASVPVSISVAQRLLPHRTSLASGLMMGGAWAFAALGPMIGQWVYEGVGLRAAFLVVAGMLAAAGAVAMLISSRLLRETALAEGDGGS